MPALPSVRKDRSATDCNLEMECFRAYEGGYVPTCHDTSSAGTTAGGAVVPAATRTEAALPRVRRIDRP